MENETGPSSELTQLVATIEQHFSKLTAAIQKHKNEIVDIIVKLERSEKESLIKAKTDLEKTIKKSKMIINAINICSDSDKAKQVRRLWLKPFIHQIENEPLFPVENKVW